MNKFSNLVRSISPFTKKKDKRSGSFDSSAKSEVEEPPVSSTYSWDLTNIDVAVALKYFYKEHNPEKINTIDYILGQYVGEEVLMLQTLCERYNVDEEDMQYYLDKGKIKKKDRKKSVAVESKSVRSVDDGKPNYSEFSWKLSGCDVGLALKQLYKDHNPLKTPNITLLNEKTNEETINLLQQLCKRHNLSEADMQAYLDMFNKRKSRSSVASPAPSAPTPKPAAAAAPSATPAAEKSPQSRVPFSSTPANNESYTTLAESPLPGSRHAPTNLATNATPFANAAGGGAVEGSETDSTPPPPPPPLTPKLGAASSATITSPPPPAPPAAPRGPSGAAGGAAAAPPPPPPPPAAAAVNSVSPTSGIARPPAPANRRRASQTPFNTGAAAAFASSNNNDEDANSVKSGMSKISMNHMRPVLANGKRFSMGPVLREISSMRLNHEEAEGALQAAAPATAPANSAAPSSSQGASASELEQIKAELELTRQQMLDVSKESQEVMRMLKDSAQTINTNLTTAAVTAITLAQQQQEQMEIEQRAKEQQKKEQIEAKRKAAAARAVEAAAEKERISAMPAQIEELTKLKTANAQRIAMLEDMERQLRSRCDQLQMKHDEMKEKHDLALLDRQDAVEDKEDLLQLISVMHSSPIAVKNILESFLNKLGQSTGSMSVMLGVSKDGTQLTIAERISEALKIKRSQGRELNNVLSPKGKPVSPRSNNTTTEESVVSMIGGGGDSVASGGGASGGSTNNNGIASSGSRAPTPTLHQSAAEGAKHTKVSEEEFKAYQRLNQQSNMMSSGGSGHVGNSNSHTGGGAGGGVVSSSGARRGNESPSMRLLQRVNSSGNGPSSPKSADQLMVEQYELAKKFFDNQQANNRIAHQMEESNLAIQELKTEQMISRTVESNKKLTSLSKTQLADDWIECYDPRTKRTYWHSPSLKKSTWHKPSANSAVVASSVDKSLHPTHLQMQQGGKAVPNGMQVLTGTNLMMMESSSEYGGSLPPSRYNSPSLARGKVMAQQQELHHTSGGYYGSEDLNIGVPRSSSNNGYGTMVNDDEQQMHATLNDIINRSKNTTQQQITQQQLYMMNQQHQQLQLSQHQQQFPSQFQSYNTAPMSTDELRSNHSFDSLFESENHYGGGPQPPSTAPSVTSEMNFTAPSATVSNSSRPSSASRARPPPSSGGRTSRSASPQLPTRGQTSKQQQLNSMPWVMAVDPKSQRKYWYNRETKVSTWRMPVELMN